MKKNRFMEKVKHYKNDDITIVWKPDICIHAAECVRGAGKVFKPKDKPWIQMENDSTETIKNAINKCPSGALSYFKNGEEPKEDESKGDLLKVQVVPDGPLIVEGSFEVDCYGTKETKSKAFLCRCGASDNKPYCDGSHKKVDFKG